MRLEADDGRPEISPRHYDEAFKRQIAQLYENGKPSRGIRAEYDIARSTPRCRYSHEGRHDTGQLRPLPDISAMQGAGRSPLHLLLDDRASRDGACGLCFCKLVSTVWALLFSSVGGWFPTETAPSEPAALFFLAIWS